MGQQVASELKRIGLLGGMSWESTAVYYRLVNEGVRDCLGPLRSADLLVRSLDFAPIAAMQYAGDWDKAGGHLAAAAAELERGGAEAIILCTNTMHKVADQISLNLTVPLLHIVDCTAATLAGHGIGSVALLGTRFTMQESFYRDRLALHGIETMVPNELSQVEISRIIYEELCAGRVHDRSRDFYRYEIAKLVKAGAEAVVLACTEIGLLIGKGDSSAPLFDTTEIHAEAAVRFALGEPQPPLREPHFSISRAS